MIKRASSAGTLPGDGGGSVPEVLREPGQRRGLPRHLDRRPAHSAPPHRTVLGQVSQDLPQLQVSLHR